MSRARVCSLFIRAVVFGGSAAGRSRLSWAQTSGTTLTANSPADRRVRDGTLTLREATLLAAGQPGVEALGGGVCAQVSHSSCRPPP